MVHSDYGVVREGLLLVTCKMCRTRSFLEKEISRQKDKDVCLGTGGFLNSWLVCPTPH